MKLKYKSSLFVIKAAIIAFFATLPMFFQLEVNSFQEICKYLGVKNDIHILDSYLNKIRFLIGDFLMSFDGSSVAFLVIFIIFICLYLKFNSIADRKLKKCIIIPSLLFAFFEVFGESFAKTDSWNLVFTNYRTVLKGCVLFIGYTSFFVIILGLLFYYLSTKKLFHTQLQEKDWFTANKKSFFVVMGIILLCWLPSLIFNFPGITNYDFFDMLDSFYGVETYSLRAVTLIDPSVTLNNNNPVLQTLLAVGCMKIGNILHLPWLGLMIFCYGQALMFAAVLSYVIYKLAQLGVHKYIRVGLVLLFGLVPVNANYAVTTLKDVNFAFVFVLYLLCLLEMVRSPEIFFRNKKKLIYFSVINLILMLLRNNGAYVLIPTDIVLCIYFRKYIKQIIFPTFIPAFVFVVIISNVIYPYFKIAPGSKREMYSVPFQQTARLVKEYGDEIPEEDRIIINKILNYDTIDERYQPELSDKVKATYKKDATAEEMRDYLGVWAKWLFIHPEVYVQATMNNCYGYFYPEAKSWIAYTEITPPGKRYGVSSPEVLSTGRRIVNEIPEIVRDIPILGLTESIGFYTWLMICSIAYLIYISKKSVILVYTPLIVLLLTCMVSPANTMMRYIYPLILGVPILIAYILHIQNEEGDVNNV
ncbi:DUF6020 family protein [Massilimicrobiota sp. An134]|jgi:hypothetical protein|uniref:DUF6020 family protein n=1 Tax=Massilimicrobiota sp. An134 TaxID=1965557 RepID=UPI000B36FC81|nr:DUF6020 family protein [Massilimicrobiota sp. An134]OUQ27261.1 hypothetical protein B5E79_10985 [Massilimicrobiota sp. An134]